MAIAVSVPAAGVTGAAQAPQSGSQQKAVAPTAAYTALSFIPSHGGTDWPAWATRFRCGA